MVRIGAALLLVMLGAGCCAPTRPVYQPPSEIIHLDDRRVQIRGRSFGLVVTVFTTKGGDGFNDPWFILSITGDACINGHELNVSWSATNGPFRPRIVGDTIHFGGHTFGITAKPGEYLADGKPITLEPGRRTIQTFQDGEYFGEENF